MKKGQSVYIIGEDGNPEKCKLTKDCDGAYGFVNKWECEGERVVFRVFKTEKEASIAGIPAKIKDLEKYLQDSLDEKLDIEESIRRTENQISKLKKKLC